MQVRHSQEPRSGRAHGARSAWRAVAGLLAAAAALSLAGCGELGADWRGLRLERPRQMSSQELALLPPGSPERALTEWLAAVERRDANAAAAAYAPSAGISAAALRMWWSNTPPPDRGSVRIVDVDRRGRSATVFVMVTTRYVAPNGRAVEFRVPRAATLVRFGGAWRLPSNWFLLSLSDAESGVDRQIKADRF